MSWESDQKPIITVVNTHSNFGKMSYIVKIFLSKNLYLFPVLVLMLCHHATGQESGETYDNENPSYLMNLRFKYLENERETETDEASYTKVLQTRTQRSLQGNLVLYFFELNGRSREYLSKTKVDAEEIKVSGSRDDILGMIRPIDFLYVWGQQKGLNSKYTDRDGSTISFQEEEEALMLSQGIGVALDTWKFGVSQKTVFNWSYNVDIENQSVIDENVEFDLDVYELVRTAPNKSEAYVEAGLKKWFSKDMADNRDGSLESTEVFVVFGYGFSEKSMFYISERYSSGKIETTLLSDSSSIKQKSSSSRSIIGLEYSISDESSIFFEQRSLNEKVDFDNVSYSNEKESSEDELTLGFRFNEQISMELTIGKAMQKRYYTDRVVLNQSSYFKQSDNLIGLSMRIHFSG